MPPTWGGTGGVRGSGGRSGGIGGRVHKVEVVQRGEEQLQQRGLEQSLHGPHEALRALTQPAQLRPLMRHLCVDPRVEDSIQEPVLQRSRAAAARTRWGFRQLAERSDEAISAANAHVPLFIGAGEEGGQQQERRSRL